MCTISEETSGQHQINYIIFVLCENFVGQYDKAHCKYLPANFRGSKEMLVRLLFLPNFLYFRKSVVKKLRVFKKV